VGATGATGAVGATGATGAAGPTGATGAGVAIGGTTNQFLVKNSATDYDTKWLATPLPIANGGTNSTATPTAGGAAYGTGTSNAYTAAGTSGQVLRSNGASAPAWASNYTGFTNHIINGDFRVNQRGWSSSTATGTFGYDRWQITNSGGTCTMSSRLFASDGTVGPATGYESERYLRVVTSGQGSTTYAWIRQMIEDVRLLAGEQITISFWAKAGSGTPKVIVHGYQHFGTGGSADVYVSAAYQTISTTWTRYSFTLTLPSIAGKTIGANNGFSFQMQFSNGYDGTLSFQNNTFDIWGVQLERGSYATPFEKRPLQQELAMCQRYFYRNAAASGKTYNQYCLGLAVSGALLDVNFSLPVPMRTSPLIALSGAFAAFGPTSAAITSAAYESGDTQSPCIRFDVTGGGGSVTTNSMYRILSNNQLNTSITFNAEL
jgi:hypothetical protein